MDDKSDEGGDLASAYLALARNGLSDSARDAISLAGIGAMAKLAVQVDTSSLSAIAGAALEGYGASAAAALGQSKIFDSAAALGALAIPSEALGASKVLGLGATMAAAFKAYEVPDVTGLASAMMPLADGLAVSKIYGDLAAPSSFLSGISESLASSKLFESVGTKDYLSGLTQSLASSKLFESIAEPSLLNGISGVLALQEQQFAKIVEPLQGYFQNIDLLGMIPTNDTSWLTRLTPVYVPLDDPVDEWLEARRPDLRGKRDGMWFAIAESPDPVSQACTSAVELLLQLFSICGVTPNKVIAWAHGTQHYAEAVDTSQGAPRVTWRGRLRLAAAIAGFDEVGQDLAASFADAPQLLQNMKHQAHHYTVDQVETQLEIVEEILRLFVGRL